MNDLISRTELMKALDNAEKEREKTGYNKITSEHVVMAIINPEYSEDSRLKKIFEKAGFTHNILLEKVTTDFDDNNHDAINALLPDDIPILTMPILPESKVKTIKIEDGVNPLKASNMIKEMMGLSSSPIEQSKMRRSKKGNGNRQEIRYYYCSECDAWHLTKTKKYDSKTL